MISRVNAPCFNILDRRLVMGRRRIPEDERRVFVGFRIQKWLLDLVKKDGKPQEIIEKLLKEKYQEKRR